MYMHMFPVVNLRNLGGSAEPLEPVLNIKPTLPADLTSQTHIREVPGYDFPCQNPWGRYGFFPGELHTIFRHGESVWTGFHTNHVSYGDFASSGAERFFAYKFGTRNMDFPREVLISVQIFKIKRHSAGM